MGFKQEAREAFDALVVRVEKLEALAAQMRRQGWGGPEIVAARPSRSASASGRVTGVDYGAIAFGLSEIKAKVAQIAPEGRERDLAQEYAGAVDYFADVFAKADPTFDRDSFNRQAGR